MTKAIRIGTRDSELALWQAKTVQRALEKLGHSTKLVPVKSKGDLVLDKPLYEFGITGIFTKTLDLAMLMGEIDIAVHSMKDVPTALPKGIVEAAVLKRADPQDLLLHKGTGFMDNPSMPAIIATGSLRRKAQWLHRFPAHEVVGLRGNVNTRLQKLEDSNWNGAIFAAAGLERLNIDWKGVLRLDWMIPAPAQGAMLVVAKEEDDFCRNALSALHHEPSGICVHIEREFLKTLEGGCTAPIGALAVVKGEKIHFEGGLFSPDGTRKFIEKTSFSIKDHERLGENAANSIISRGGKELMEQVNQNRDN